MNQKSIKFVTVLVAVVLLVSVGFILLAGGILWRFPDINTSFDRWKYVRERLDQTENAVDLSGAEMEITAQVGGGILTISPAINPKKQIYFVESKLDQIEIIYEDQTLYVIHGILPQPLDVFYLTPPTYNARLLNMGAHSTTLELPIDKENLTEEPDQYLEKQIPALKKVVFLQGYLMAEELCERNYKTPEIDDFCQADLPDQTVFTSVEHYFGLQHFLRSEIEL